MTSIKQRKAELEREIKKFNQAYEDWNNKKLNEEVRKKAEKYVDEMTDKDRFPSMLEAELKGITFAQAEMLKRIDDKFDFKEEDKLCFWKRKEDNTWSRNVIDFVKKLKSQLGGEEK